MEQKNERKPRTRTLLKKSNTSSGKNEYIPKKRITNGSTDEPKKLIRKKRDTEKPVKSDRKEKTYESKDHQKRHALKLNDGRGVGAKENKKEERSFGRKKQAGRGGRNSDRFDDKSKSERSTGPKKYFAEKDKHHDRFEEHRPEKTHRRDAFDEHSPSADTHYEKRSPYSKKKQLEHKIENPDSTKPIRLNKFIANAGICSRREADEYIKAGVVRINDVITTELGSKVNPGDAVKFNDSLLKSERKVYLLLNKPKDYITTTDDPHAKNTVMDLIQGACKERIYPVGRLDRNTTGLLLFTNDGEMAKKLTHPKYLKKKIYHVVLNKELATPDMVKILGGIETEEGIITADDVSYVEQTDKTQVGIELHTGQNHAVKHIFESLGYHVEKLDRVYFAGLTKKNLPRGEWRFLSQKEIEMLRMGAYA